MQATIWRVPKGGGAPKIWYQHSKFASPYIGTNGLRLSPDGTRVYVTVTVDMLAAASVYSLPLVAKPTPAQLHLVHHFAAGELPDAIAFGSTGDLYVAMASPVSAGVMILCPDGTVAARLTNPQGSLVAPYDGPANIAFDGARPQTASRDPALVPGHGRGQATTPAWMLVRTGSCATPGSGGGSPRQRLLAGASASTPPSGMSTLPSCAARRASSVRERTPSLR